MELKYLLFFIIVGVNGQISPCPNIFQYNFKDTEWFGLLTIPSNGKAHMELNVILTVEGVISKNDVGQIVLQNEIDTVVQTIREQGIFRFKVIFPNSNKIPHLKSILLNGQEICHNGKVQTKGTISTITLSYKLDSQESDTGFEDGQPLQPNPIPVQNISEYPEHINREDQSVKEQPLYEDEPPKTFTTTTNTSSTITTIKKTTNTTVTTITSG